MTDKEMLQALRCCTSNPDCDRCKSECIFYKSPDPNDCIPEMGNAVADRLEALVAENERLRAAKDTNVPTMREKGATEFDKLCHKVFDANWKNYRARETGVKCRCGHQLEAYYCEERLFLVECDQCETKALVKARSPKEAAYRAFAFEVMPVDKMDCEHEAVFFHHTPIDEPPVYIGSTIACDFPDDVVCGMYLPCPGTDGRELGGGVNERRQVPRVQVQNNAPRNDV